MQLIYSSAPVQPEQPTGHKESETAADGEVEGVGESSEGEAGATSSQPIQRPHKPLANIQPYILLCDHQIGMYILSVLVLVRVYMFGV